MRDDCLIGLEWEPQFSLLEFPKQFISFIRKENLDFWMYYPDSEILTISGNSDILICTCIPISSEKHFKYIFIALSDEYVPLYYPKSSQNYLTVDRAVFNLEIRTQPVRLELIKDHSEFCTEYLKHFVEDLSQFTNGVGVLMPVTATPIGPSHSFPNKHVNISFPNEASYIKRFSEVGENMWKWFYNGYTSSDYLKLRHFKTHVCIKYSMTSHSAQRLHIMVPYNFNDYETLIRHAYSIWTQPDPLLLMQGIYDLSVYLDAWYEDNKQKDPILLLHTSKSNDKVQTVHQLF